MVNFCAVPGCSNRSDRENHLCYYRLPLKNKAVLKQWIHNIGRANLPLKNHRRVCSEHFVNARGRTLRPDELPTVKLPVLSTKVSSAPPRRSIVRHKLPENAEVKFQHNTETQASTQSCLGLILNCSRTSCVDQKRVRRIWKNSVQI